MKDCKQCGEPVTASDSRQKFCNRRCAALFNNSVRGAETYRQPEGKCKQCGSPCSTKNVYCGSECRSFSITYKKSSNSLCLECSEPRFRDARCQKHYRAKVMEAKRRWRLNNPNAKERDYEQDVRRRAIKLGQLGFVPTNYREILLEFFGTSCMNPDCDGDAETIDHVVPISWGPRLGLNDLHDIRNMQLLCKSCNSSKGARSSVDYRERHLTAEDLSAILKLNMPS